jgi:hypothetical protein
MPEKTSMSPIIIVDNEYITVRYLPDKKIVYHTVHKPIESKLFMSALDAGGEVLRKKGACKWLSDDRKNGPLSPEMIAGPAIWGPGMVAAGWKYWANVVPREIISAGTLKPVMETLFDLGLRMNVFNNVEDAFQWLESMKD